MKVKVTFRVNGEFVCKMDADYDPVKDNLKVDDINIEVDKGDELEMSFTLPDDTEVTIFRVCL